MISDLNYKLEMFFKSYPVQTFSEGQWFYQPYDKITKLYFLQSGQVRHFAISRSGEEVMIHMYDKSSVFPLMLALSEQENRFFIQAKGKVTVSVCPLNEFLDFLHKDPELVKEFLVRFSKAVYGLSARLEIMTPARAKDRLLALLIYFAKRYGSDEGKYIKFKTDTTQTEYASWIGTSRETVSRIFTQLKNEALVIEKNSYLILSKELFEE